MGYLYKSVCFADLTTARQHYAADLLTQWGNGSTVMRSEVVSTDFTQPTYTLCTRVDGGPCSLIDYPFPTLAECDFGQGVALSTEMFALLLGFLVVVWVSSILYRMFWRPYDPA